VALEVARDMLPVGEAGEIKVEVNDDAGHRLVTITVSIGSGESPVRHHRPGGDRSDPRGRPRRRYAVAGNLFRGRARLTGGGSPERNL
jgi:hypothetical protein